MSCWLPFLPSFPMQSNPIAASRPHFIGLHFSWGKGRWVRGRGEHRQRGEGEGLRAKSVTRGQKQVSDFDLVGLFTIEI